MPPSGIEVAWVTPAELLGAFVVSVVLALLAVAVTAWAVRGGVESEPESVDEPARIDDPDATVEFRTRAPLSRPRNTGTVHVPGVRPVPADDPTVVIRLPKGVERS